MSMSPAFCSLMSILRAFGFLAGGHACTCMSVFGVEGAVASHSADVLASAVAAAVFVARCAFMQGGIGGGGGAGIGMYEGIMAGYGVAYTGGAV